MTDKNDSDEPIKRRGRPPIIDWNELFKRWLSSNKSKSKFLSDLGISPTSGAASRNTKDWNLRVKKAYKNIRRTNQEIEDDFPERPVVPVQSDNVTHQVNDMWKMIQEWRENQAGNDYKMADNIRAHIKLILNSAVIRNMDKEGQVVIQSKLRPHEIKSLSGALETLQKVQRLALGLSTENVGVETKIESTTHIETKEEQCPIFEVQINKNGKFERARPAQLR